ncbi:MAG: prepilin-type N-terminal cleavage/methylation domain-containing protein [Gemmatimonadales bacterium]|nr:prepilin-type N-terminal cleavage/methylation domain-containing protein [Gemmatimonadales bacterium]
MRNTRGFTLVELMIVVVMMAIIGGAMVRMLTNTQRLSREQAERVGLQSNLRTGAFLVPSELAEVGINATASDLQVMGANAIQYRAMRGAGVSCQVTATEIRLWDIPEMPYYGIRNMITANNRDRILIFAEIDPADPNDDIWIDRQLTGVTPSTCAGRPAIALTFADISAATPNGIVDVMAGGPVRSYEIMRLESFTQNGQLWLGARSVSAGEVALQPVLGPLAANGFQLEYLDGNGNPTGAATGVRAIRVTLRGLTQAAVSRGLGQANMVAQDSLVAMIALRNAPKP